MYQHLSLNKLLIILEKLKEQGYGEYSIIDTSFAYDSLEVIVNDEYHTISIGLK